MLKIITLSAVIATTLMAESSCSDVKDLKQHNGHYYGISNKKMTFNNAKKFAEQKGGYLAIPNSAAENAFLKSILGGRNGGWLGIYDPSDSSDYSFYVGEKVNASRFKTIQDSALTYSNWQPTQPDNFVHEYDVFQGTQRVAPLGENWVAMDGNSGRWWDHGNHYTDGDALFYALMEFDTMPSCFEDLSSNVTDVIEGMKCTTQIWDDRTGNLETGSVFDCEEDKYGNTYCPSALGQCGQEWDYDAGYTVSSGVGQVVDYVKKNPQSTTTTEVYDNWEAIDYFQTWDLVGSLLYFGYQCKNGVLREGSNMDMSRLFTGPLFYKDESLRVIANPYYGMPISKYPYLSGGSNNGKGYVRDGSWWNSASAQTKIDSMLSRNMAIQTFGSCCAQLWRLCTKTITVVVPPACPSGYTETTGAETSKGECKKTIQYTYYNYLCNSSPNAQGYDYIPQNLGGDCKKTDTSGTANNSADLAKPCNTPNPPATNCKREKYMCQANRDRPCSFVDNKWQCSPFPCYGEKDTEIEGDVEGANDKNNNGWGEDGMCNGQIYIFNGKDRRCRSSDTFGGLAGGGCCNKDKVFLGLIQCKENEKLLAKQNKSELCTEIGEYCSKKLNLGFTKICIQKSKGFCCFGTKLSRFVHEQGRGQIGLSWGSAESPNCRGFTPEEFQKLDFSKINLEGAFDMPEVTPAQLNGAIDTAVNNFKNMIQNGN